LAPLRRIQNNISQWDFISSNRGGAGGLKPEGDVQYSLFDDTLKIEKMHRSYSALDELSAKYGKYAVHHGASLPTKLQARHEGEPVMFCEAEGIV